MKKNFYFLFQVPIWSKTLFLLSIFFITCAPPSNLATVDGVQNETVIQDVNVIPMDRERVLHNQVVVIRDGKITAMGDVGKVSYSKNALVIDGKGKFLIPGLAEMHAHVPPNNDLETMKEVMMLFAVNGVTTIRGMLGHPKHLELSEKVKNSEILGPRFYTSGPSFNGNSVKTPEAAITMVRQQKDAGYDFLKIHPGIKREAYDAMAATAKQANIPFGGHVPFEVGVFRAIEAGQKTIDHLDGFVESLVPGIENIPEGERGLFGLFVGDKADEKGIPKLIAALRKGNVAVVPTQALPERWMTPAKTADEFRNEPEMKYMAANTLKNWSDMKNNLQKNSQYTAGSVNKFIVLTRKLIFECHKGGVLLLLGSDAPQVFNVPGFSVHHELKYLVGAGLTPFEALQTGTVNVGKFYNRQDIGTIKPGAVADLVLLNSNPLQNISNTKHIEGVMLNGKWLTKDFIQTELKKLEKN